MENLIHILNFIKPLSEEASNYLRAKLKKVTIEKNKNILEPGTVSKKIFFVEKGLLRGYFFANDKEHSSWFFKENDVVISIDSFYSQSPSNEFIETLEECILWTMSHEELQYLYNSIDDFNYHSRVLTEKYYCLSEQRNYLLRIKNLESRYKYLIGHIPDIMSRVSVKKIATYLEVEPETVSRIRSKKMF